MKPSYPWSPTRFKHKLKQHDLTPERAADLVGATRRTGYNWVERGPPYVVALVYELMERYSITPADLEKIGEQLTTRRH